MSLHASAIHFERSAARNSCKTCGPFSARSGSGRILFVLAARRQTSSGLLPPLALRRFLRFSFPRSARSSSAGHNVRAMEMEVSFTRRAEVPVAAGEDAEAEVAEEEVVVGVGAES